MISRCTSGEFGETPVVFDNEAIPSRAAEGFGSAKGVETREMSPNNNSLHERPISLRHNKKGDNDIVHTLAKAGETRYDSLVRTTGDPSPAIAVSTKLFGNANVGDVSRTNLQVAGQLASDQTYAILALRCWLYFRGTNHRANYLLTASQLYFTLTLGDEELVTLLE